MKIRLTLLLLIFISIQGCGDNSSDSDSNETNKSSLIYNREAPIPPQCYTKTENTFNPCYTCHQSYTDNRTNVQNDGDLQGDYAFSWLGVSNYWSNLFIDRTDLVAQISDTEILDYVSNENYSALKTKLSADADWKGYIPDLVNYPLAEEAFDEQGMAKDGSGWVAFNYKPLPSTFWPSNGSTDDVVLRLPTEFQNASCGEEGHSRDVYFTNLALLEASIKQVDSISLPPVDENKLCMDLNNDGIYSIITEITHLPENYVGGASDIKRHETLYPLNTEFLHSVRYVGVDEEGNIFLPPRMKELRYMKKTHFYNKSELEGQYALEVLNKEDEIIPTYTNTGHGLANSYGWLVLGFIEDENGELRQQTHEENKFCMGCHSSVGTTIDQTFAFPRKVTGANGWGYIDLKGMKDAPTKGETDGEILTYLKRVGGGSEFRNNEEMRQRWFNSDGSVKEEQVKASDVYTLITPSRERALQLNKAYKTIVDEQSFIYGRDAIITPPENVYSRVPTESPPLDEEHRHTWDIRMDWGDD